VREQIWDLPESLVENINSAPTSGQIFLSALAKAVAAARTAKEKLDKSGAASRKGEKYNIASGGSFVLGGGGVTRRHVAPLALLTLR
jgi:hypothetical protein